MVRWVRLTLERGVGAQGMLTVGLHGLMLMAAADPAAEVDWLKRRLVDALLEGV